MFAGFVFIGQAMNMPVGPLARMVRWVFLGPGIFLIFQGFYFYLRYQNDKQFQVIMRALLSVGEDREQN